MSLSSVEDHRLLEKAVEYATGRGVTIVAAAGNRGIECVEFPARRANDPVIAVAASEVAVGLGIVISMFRNRDSVDIEDVSLLRW